MMSSNKIPASNVHRWLLLLWCCCCLWNACGCLRGCLCFGRTLLMPFANNLASKIAENQTHQLSRNQNHLFAVWPHPWKHIWHAIVGNWPFCVHLWHPGSSAWCWGLYLWWYAAQGQSLPAKLAHKTNQTLKPNQVQIINSKIVILLNIRLHLCCAKDFSICCIRASADPLVNLCNSQEKNEKICKNKPIHGTFKPSPGAPAPSSEPQAPEGAGCSRSSPPSGLDSGVGSKSICNSSMGKSSAKASCKNKIKQTIK